MKNNEDRAREEGSARVLRGRRTDQAIAPSPAIEARLRRRSAFGLIAGTGAVVLLLALVVGNALPERRGVMSGDAAVSASTSSVGRTTPTSRASVLSEQFGFVWVDEGHLSVQPETGRDGFELSARPYGFSPCSCAVSPDGTRIVYWTTSPLGAPELQVVELARPTDGRTLYIAPVNTRISGAAWSSDGTGVLFSLEVAGAPSDADAGPQTSVLLAIEGSGGPVLTLFDSGRSGTTLMPLGWDRGAAVAAAALSGPGGFMRGYLTVHTMGDPSPRTTAITQDVLIASIDISADQRYVLGVFFDQAGSVMRWWKLTDFSAIVSGPRVSDRARPKWRPLTSEIAWIDGPILELFDVDRGVLVGRQTFLQGDYGLTVFRRDGSAVLITASGGHTNALLDLASGETASISSSTSYVAASVRFR